jgi:hypothetical protein
MHGRTLLEIVKDRLQIGYSVQRRPPLTVINADVQEHVDTVLTSHFVFCLHHFYDAL